LVEKMEKMMESDLAAMKAYLVAAEKVLIKVAAMEQLMGGKRVVWKELWMVGLLG
jgi:hypothetical protein